MTREDIADEVDVFAFRDGLGDAVRALPVLATCGPCRHLVSNPARVGLWCDREKRALVSDAERRPVAPPSWCPLRGAVGR